MGRTSDARERLIRTAMELIWQNSYHAVGVEALCRKAAVNKGSFYHFFASKRDLALASLEATWHFAEQHSLRPAFTMDGSLRERFARFFALVTEVNRQDHIERGLIGGCPFGNLGNEMSGEDKALRDKVQSIFMRYIAYFEDAIREAIRRGEISAALDAGKIARLLFTYWQGVFLLTKTSNSIATMEELSGGALRILDGLTNEVAV